MVVGVTGQVEMEVLANSWEGGMCRRRSLGFFIIDQTQ